MMPDALPQQDFIAHLADAEVPLSTVKDGMAYGYNGVLYVNIAGATLDLVSASQVPKLDPAIKVRVATVDKLLR
jgi:hypothetical protein